MELQATFGAHKINFKAPYARVTMTDSNKKHFTDFDISGKSEIELMMLLTMGIDVDSTWVRKIN
jgi:lysyl-tRNA synthetase class 2